MGGNDDDDVDRIKAAEAIVDFEARRDKKGHLVVYKLPPNDGGGRFEVAGINERYNLQECTTLVGLIEDKKYDEAETYACEVIARDTDAAERWHTDPGVRFYLRDSIFNRGNHGAARILQRAVGTKDDGIVGPKTRAAIAKFGVADLLTKLRWAREDYERHVVGYRANFWEGLVNRWDKALVTARKFSGI
jgi:hypothetical protein